MQEKCEGHAKKEGGKRQCQEAIGFAIPPTNYVTMQKKCNCDAIIFSPISCTVFLLFS